MCCEDWSRRTRGWSTYLSHISVLPVLIFPWPQGLRVIWAFWLYIFFLICFIIFLLCFKEILMLLTAFNSSCSMLRWCLCQTADSSPSASGSAGLTPLSKPPGSFNTAFQQGFGLCLTHFLNAPEIIKITCEHTTYHHHMWRPVDKMQFGVLHCHSATSKQCE